MMRTIAGLAREGGVAVETIRYYQRRGLLDVPPRPDGGGLGGGIRRYGDEPLRRLRFIRSAQAAGFTLDAIGHLLRLDATEDRAAAHAIAEDRIAALDARIAEMQRARDALVRLARACAATADGPCPIIAAFEAAGPGAGDDPNA